VADAGASQFERGSIPQGQGFDSQLMEVELAQVPNPATRYVFYPTGRGGHAQHPPTKRDHHRVG